MSSTKGPAKRTRIADGRFYFVRAEGKRRIWVPLTKVTEGLPAFYAALARELKAPIASDLMPLVIAAWEAEVMSAHAETTQRDERARGKVIAERFEEFRACEVRPADVSEFLQVFRTKAKTHNFYRAQIGDLMRFAMLKGWRDLGTNPVTGIIPTLKTPPRDRYPTDSEVRRIKVAGIYGKDGRKTRSGLMLAALVDMAYLTGQRISDLLTLEWGQISQAGILFKPSKTKGSTGASVIIGWSPKLEALVARLRALRVTRRNFGPAVFTKQTGAPWRYGGAHSAWARAAERAGIDNCRFNDIRAKALTDDEEAHGMQSARRKGAHSTEQQTSDYVRHKRPQKAKATR
jgi:integrase